MAGKLVTRLSKRQCFTLTEMDTVKTASEKFQKYNDVFKKYHSWLNENNIGPFDACLLYVNSIKLVDKIVVGVDNLQQLNQIINFKFIKKKLNFKKMNCLKIKLINPSAW